MTNEYFEEYFDNRREMIMKNIQRRQNIPKEKIRVLDSIDVYTVRELIHNPSIGIVIIRSKSDKMLLDALTNAGKVVYDNVTLEEPRLRSLISYAILKSSGVLNYCENSDTKDVEINRDVLNLSRAIIYDKFTDLHFKSLLSRDVKSRIVYIKPKLDLDKKKILEEAGYTIYDNMSDEEFIQKRYDKMNARMLVNSHYGL